MDMDVTAKFRADISDMAAKMSALDKQMKGLGDSADNASKSISQRFNDAGKSMTDAGKKMSLAVTAPLVGIGIAAAKTSMDFEKSLSTMVGLVGLTNDEVESFRGTILQLAGDTAKAPQELADAMFVVTSAGLRGEAAVSALEQAARASAAGLGETADIARSVAGAVNAYGAANLDAATATDVIVATARAGNFETSQFAGAIGRVLPFAKQAGASIQDMGGAVALLTRTNGDAAQSVTQVASLFRSFVVPTEEAKKALADVGMSAGDMRKAIAEQGLPAALTMLDQKLGGNREQLGRLLGSSEAASAAFQILDSDAASIAGTFGVVNDSVGMTGDAFDAAAETSGFKFQQAMVSIKAALIEIGDIITPVIATISQKFRDLVTRFTELSPAVQTTVVVIGAFAAAAGPALIIAGQLTGAVGNLMKAYAAMPNVLNKVKTAVTSMNAAFLTNPVTLIIVGIVAAAAALAVAFKAIYDRSEVLRKAVSDLFNTFKAIVGVIVGDVIRAFSSLFGSQKKTEGGMASFGDLMQKIADVAGPILGKALQVVGNYLKVLGNIIRVVIKGVEIAVTVFKMIANIIRAGVILAVQKAIDIFQGLMDKLGPVGKFVQNAASQMGKAFAAIPRFISDAFRTAVGFVEGAINAAIGAVNFLIRAYNKIPFVTQIAELEEFRFESFKSSADAAASSVNNLANQVGGYASQVMRGNEVVDASFRPVTEAIEETVEKQEKLEGAGNKTDKVLERLKKQADQLTEAMTGARDAIMSIGDAAENKFGEASMIEKAFGTEGDISSAIGAYDQLDAALRDYYNSLLKAPNLSKKVTNALKAERDQQRAALRGAVQDQIDLYRQRAQIQEAMAQLERDYEKSVNEINARYDQLDKAAEENTKRIEAHWASVIPRLEDALKRANDAFERENSVLQGLIQQRDGYLNQVASSFRGFVNQISFGEDPGADTIRATLEDRLNAVREFATNIRTLVQRGLDPTLVQEFISAGVSGAGQAAAALAAGSQEEIAAINQVQAGLAAEIAAFGEFGAEQWYNAGIAQQQAIVAPLQIAAEQAQTALDLANTSRDSELAAARAHAETLKVERQAALAQAKLDYQAQNAALKLQMDATNTAIAEGAAELQTQFTNLRNTLPVQMHQIGYASANMTLRGFKQRYPALSEKLNNMMTALANSMKRETTITVTTVHRSVFEGSTPPGRALGGPVAARQAYIVGERGPELFVSNQAGNIIPNNQLGSLPNMSAGRNVPTGGATVINMNINAGMGADGAEVGRQVVEAIRKYERRSGPVFVSA